MLRRVARYVAGRLLPRRAYTVRLGPLKGAKFVLGALSGEGGGSSVYVGGVEPEQTSAFVEAIRPGSAFFDIGANVGYYTVLASRLVGGDGRVIAFEPVPRNLEFLRRHLELNCLANVTVVPMAVSDNCGTAGFSLGLDTAMGHIGEDGEITVETTTLDHMVDQLGCGPDVVKIDVEGSEIEVLTGAAETLRTHKPMIFLSTHSNKLREDCLAHLRGLGYSVEPLIAGDDPHEFIAKHIG